MKKTTLKLTFDQVNIINYLLQKALDVEFHRESEYQKLYFQVLSEILVKKIYPKTLLDTGVLSIQFKPQQITALGIAMISVDVSQEGIYFQNQMRLIQMAMPKVVFQSEDVLELPDRW